MTSVSEQEVFQSAMSLPEPRRAELAERLWSSLGDGPQDEIAAAWAAELNRRLSDLDAGRTTTLSGDKAMAALKAKYQVTP